MSRFMVVCSYVALAMTVVANGACKKRRKVHTRTATVAKGDTFSVPVPAGYSLVTDPRFTKGAPGGVVLLSDKPMSKKGRRGSIVVTRVPPGPDFDMKKAGTCRVIATAVTKMAPVKIIRSALVDTAAGRACQWELRDKNVANWGAVGTVMYKTRANCWVITCSFDTRDSGARKACAAVLQGWKFNP